MPHPPTSDHRRAVRRAAIVVAFSAVMLPAASWSLAAEPESTPPAQSSTAAESQPSAVGPLSPVRREPPTSAQSASKPPSAATKPTIKMPAPATTSPADNAASSATPPVATPQPKQAEQTAAPTPAPKHATPQPKEAERATAAAPASKPAKPERKEAQEATPPRPHRRATRSAPATVNAPSEHRPAVVERREPMVEVDRMPPRERVYREEYSWSDEPPFVARRAMPYPPPRVYGEAPEDVGPAPFAPPWSYRYRSFAWGPYPGMPGPRFGPPY